MDTIAADRSDDEPDIRRLTFDLDVEVCVVGGGLAGLSVACEAARMGASVALLEAGRIGWGASGHHLGSVRPGFDVDAGTVIARIGRTAAAELWRMSQIGADIVRVQADAMPDVAITEGALDVATGLGGERALDRVAALGSEFGLHARRWNAAQVRSTLDSRYYFGGLHHPKAFQLDGAAYLRGLVALARQAGVRIFEQTPVLAMDASGARKRIGTPSARLRAGHVVLAGNVHLGAVLPRLAATLLPVWRTVAITAPLGERLRGVIDTAQSVVDSDGVDRFRVLGDGRLMWSRRETTWQAADSSGSAVRRRIARVFPALGRVQVVETFGGAIGQTVHGMPQIGQLRPGLWVASGFGRQGMNTTAMAGRVIAKAIVVNDDRWRLFTPFELIWTGGRTGRVAGYVIDRAVRVRAATASAWARRLEATEAAADRRRSRLAAIGAPRDAAPERPQPLPAAHRPTVELDRDPLPPSPFLSVSRPDDADPSARSQESERIGNAPA